VPTVLYEEVETERSIAIRIICKRAALKPKPHLMSLSVAHCPSICTNLSEPSSFDGFRLHFLYVYHERLDVDVLLT